METKFETAAEVVAMSEMLPPEAAPSPTLVA